MTGCLSCSDSVTCALCDTANLFVANGTACSCAPQYYLSAGNCLACSSGCTACDSTGVTCTACDTSQGLSLVMGVCVCASGFYAQASGTGCIDCSITFQWCNACTVSACSSCQPPAVISASGCICPIGYYNSATSCQTCSSITVGCSQCSSSACSACDTAAFFQPLTSSGNCICQLSYILIGSNCVSCASMLSGCLDCSDSSTCLACDATNNFALSGVQCVCTSGYVLDSSGNCAKSQNQTITIVLVNTIKNITGNSVGFHFKLSPVMAAFDTMDFSQAILLNLTDSAQLSFSYQGNGMLTVIAQYNSSIQGKNVSLTFDASLVSSQFSGTTSYNMNFTVDPSNNVPAIFYQDTAYQGVDTMNLFSKILAYFALAMFLASLFTAKFVGVEMIGVIQVAFIGLMTVTNLPPLLSTLSNMIKSMAITVLLTPVRAHLSYPFEWLVFSIAISWHKISTIHLSCFCSRY